MGLRTTAGTVDGPVKGRGAASNPEGRFDAWRREREDDGWSMPQAAGKGEREACPPATDPPPRPRTVVTDESVVRIVSRHASPDLPFEQSLNPYAGCEHGCSYCYARPSHAFFGLSPGLDFETRIFARHDAAARLRDELARPRYRCRPIAIGGNTDPYQPAERGRGITRSVIQVLADCRHPFSIVTKNALVERDIDLIAPMAARGLAHVFVSITSLDAELSWKLEPRASAPWRRLQAVRRLADAGIPVGVMVAPVIPALTDRFMEEILERSKEAGARTAAWVLLRLPNEVETVFTEWLAVHEPLRAEHVLNQLRAMHGGRVYDSRFHHRQRGAGPMAELLARRFGLATRRLGLDARLPPQDTTLFRPPGDPRQATLF